MALWDEVSKEYGHAIREESIDSPGLVGFSDVDEDGTPLIRLSKQGVSESYVVHELMHLKLKLEGYPARIHWMYSCPNDEGLQPWLSTNLKDTIEHWIFQPRVIAMGLSPDEELAADVRRAIQADYPDNERLASYKLAFELFRVLTLPNQSRLSEELTAWYQKKGWTQAIQIGNQMFAILASQRPSTPEQEIMVFVACANLLFRESRRFEERGWTSFRVGELNLRSVDIATIPLVPCTP